MKLMAIDDNLLDILRKISNCYFFGKLPQEKTAENMESNNPIIQTINIFMAFIKKNFCSSHVCGTESSEDFGRVCDSSYSEVPSSDGSSN